MRKRREPLAFIVEKDEFDNAEVTQGVDILKNFITDCKDKFLHTFEYSCDYDTNIELASPNEIFYSEIVNYFKLPRSNPIHCLKKLMNVKKDGHKIQ